MTRTLRLRSRVMGNHHARFCRRVFPAKERLSHQNWSVEQGILTIPVCLDGKVQQIHHKLSRQIVNHAYEQGVGTIKVESLQGIRKGTTSKSRGAKARKNNRMKNSWSFYQLTAFIAYKAERLGIKVEQVDPAYTSQECPACSARNKAVDRTYVCAECGWMGHRDMVGAINISRRAGLSGERIGAIGA